MRVWFGLAAVGLAAVVLAASGQGGSEAEQRGRAEVEKACSGCHKDAQLEALVRRRIGGAADPAAALDPFLRSHHAPDAGVRADVIAYLARLVAAGGSVD